MNGRIVIQYRRPTGWFTAISAPGETFSEMDESIWKRWLDVLEVRELVPHLETFTDTTLTSDMTTDEELAA